ncbi:FAD binding domain-containing protein [Sinobaca qinghaiensis]|uniref:FAD binding domain-containing protein n=1 Tax=Sinobaca qinghaiensis TaxID=342944 RepID=A0A419V4F8_9BACL|nr:NAD(P)/FAD-dependent oxidoreductase [Sinobaca qinghaiensis]RKD73373.1 FAD binding domain-containing protein [Sinobaca qinghaiensis]
MYDLIVIGAGPAGSSAAIFAAKAGKHTLVIDNEQSMTKAAWVENHYGAPDTAGPDLLETGKKQAEKHGAERIMATVIKLEELENGRIKVYLEDRDFEAAYVLLTTGNNPQLPEAAGIEMEEGTEPRIKKIVKTDASGRTSMKRVWAAGTIAGVSVHTIITSGDGARTAVNILSEMNGKRYVDHDVLKK